MNATESLDPGAERLAWDAPVGHLPILTDYWTEVPGVAGSCVGFWRRGGDFKHGPPSFYVFTDGVPSMPAVVGGETVGELVTAYLRAYVETSVAGAEVLAALQPEDLYRAALVLAAGKGEGSE